MKHTKDLRTAFTGGKDGVEKKTDLMKMSTALTT